MRGNWSQPSSSAAEEADRDKKRRQNRRQNRRPRQTPPLLPLPGHGSVDAAGRPAPPQVAFNSLPAMHINRCGGGDGDGDGDSPAEAPSQTSSSCPLPALRPSGPSEPVHSGAVRVKHFCTHWSDQAVEEAIEKGKAFKAKFRVNAQNRLEAYCSVDGVPTDILINGSVPQNRAIEGDVVAIMLDPVTFWTRLKGSYVPSNLGPIDGSNISPEVREIVGNNTASKEQVDAICAMQACRNGLLQLDQGHHCHENDNVIEGLYSDMENKLGTSNNGLATSQDLFGERQPAVLGSSNARCDLVQGEAARAIERICAMIGSYPSKRPTGKVLSIMKKSPRRGTVIGFLAVQQWLYEHGAHRNQNEQFSRQLPRNSNGPVSASSKEYIQLIPTDPKFPLMAVSVCSLPDHVKERLHNGDMSVEMELVAARIDEWNEESLYPQAHVIHILGRGGEIEPQIAAILFENAIRDAIFSPESLNCLPDIPWKIPSEEFKTRKDLRNICMFTIDPSSAVDLDDALSVEVVSAEIFRIGVHIADASYFICPDTVLDTEAQIRSTSVYILQHKVPMLPPKLSEELGSLLPGRDRLAFSIIMDITRSGEVIDQWIGRSIINSCCKLSYDAVQDVIDGSMDADRLGHSGISGPQLHGQFNWQDITTALRNLHEISKRLREIRFKDGALWLENAKLGFLFDECGTPCDSFFSERKESCSIVEEFMLLANRSVAEVIARAFPDCALLRRHPEPNLRKLKEFEAFSSRHGFELDTSSSGHFHISMSKIREKLKNDPVLCDILVSYASKPMQSAAYFCTGDLRGRENDWAHYSLSVPFYTHFTSPLRRYPDIIVHRTLSAVLYAEEIYMKQKNGFLRAKNGEIAGFENASKCFTGIHFRKDAAESKEGKEALSAAALKFKVPGIEVLAEVAAYCNERKLASRHAEEAGAKLYLWVLLKKNKVTFSEARIMGLGPRFMLLYINELAIERRIYYDNVEGLTVEWLESTCTLVLDIVRNKPFHRRGSPGKLRAIEDVALVVNPSEIPSGEDYCANEAEPSNSSLTPPCPVEKTETCPAFFPMALQHLSSIPVALHAVGGDDGLIDIGARLYTCAYLM